MTAIRLGSDLALPPELATQTILIVGKRGSGKTTTAVRMAEQFYAAKIPFVVIDPVDVWHGLKASRDGKHAGLSVYVFGGRHADLPLEPTGGQLVADLLVDHRISAVLSVKHFSGRERSRFVSDLAERLFKRNTEPLHVFLEEAHEVAPQNPYKGEEEMLGRVTRIWKLGRSSGLGGSAVTQRPASLSKNITTQAEILIVHRMLGPQDVAAIREWIKYHGESDDVLSQLAGLKTGEAWIWAPDFPEGKPIGLKRVKILDRETFDSSATPKSGERKHEPKELAPVDLDAVKAKMAATIERAKAEDPRELRKRIAELERELRKANERGAVPTVEIRTERVEVPTFDQEAAAAISSAADFIRGRADEITHQVREASVRASLKTASAAKNARKSPATTRGGTHEEVGRAGERRRQASEKDAGADLPRGEQRILTAIAQYSGQAVSRETLSVLTGYKRSARDTYLQRLSQKALVRDDHTGLIATEAGLAHLNHHPPDVREENLLAMCQTCHLRYDRLMHGESSARTRQAQRSRNQSSLFRPADKAEKEG